MARQFIVQSADGRRFRVEAPEDSQVSPVSPTANIPFTPGGLLQRAGIAAQQTGQEAGNIAFGLGQGASGRLLRPLAERFGFHPPPPNMPAETIGSLLPAGAAVKGVGMAATRFFPEAMSALAPRAAVGALQGLAAVKATDIPSTVQHPLQVGIPEVLGTTLGGLTGMGLATKQGFSRIRGVQSSPFIGEIVDKVGTRQYRLGEAFKAAIQQVETDHPASGADAAPFLTKVRQMYISDPAHSTLLDLAREKFTALAGHDPLEPFLGRIGEAPGGLPKTVYLKPTQLQDLVGVMEQVPSVRGRIDPAIRLPVSAERYRSLIDEAQALVKSSLPSGKAEAIFRPYIQGRKELEDIQKFFARTPKDLTPGEFIKKAKLSKLIQSEDTLLGNRPLADALQKILGSGTFQQLKSASQATRYGPAAGIGAAVAALFGVKGISYLAEREALRGLR